MRTLLASNVRAKLTNTEKETEMRQSLVARAASLSAAFSANFGKGAEQMREALSKVIRHTIPEAIRSQGYTAADLGGYNRRRAITAATSKRAARKRRNIAKRSPH